MEKSLTLESKKIIDNRKKNNLEIFNAGLVLIHFHYTQY